MLVMSRLIPVVPALVAMSANSPFWRGHVTGHAAYRHRILAAAPNYGLPTACNSWAAFEQFLEAALRSSMIRHFKDIHWDIRPHPDFGLRRQTRSPLPSIDVTQEAAADPQPPATMGMRRMTAPSGTEVVANLGRDTSLSPNRTTAISALGSTAFMRTSRVRSGRQASGLPSTSITRSHRFAPGGPTPRENRFPGA